MLKRTKISTLLSEHGIGESTWLGFRFLLRKIVGISWQRFIYFERPLDKAIAEITPKIPVRVGLATIDDMDKFKGMFDENKHNSLRQRFTKGQLCFSAQYGSRVVAQQWISYQDEYYAEKQLKIEVKNNEGYLFDAYVVPEYRNNKLYSILIATTLKYLHDHGYEKATTYIADYNKFPLRTCAAQGFIPKRTVLDIDLFGRHYHHWNERAEIQNLGSKFTAGAYTPANRTGDKSECRRIKSR
jgi:hypothetical protein